MIITKRYLSEMVASIISGGKIQEGKKYPYPVIEAFIQQELNKRMRTEYFQVTLPADETTPDGMTLVSFDGIAVEKYRNVSRAKLPAMPVSLPRDMGVFSIIAAIPGSGGGTTPQPTGDVSYFIAEGVVGGNMHTLGFDDPVSGLTDGSQVVTSNDFAGKYVRVFRGSLPVPGIDTGDGGLYYSKSLGNNFISFNQPMADGEYIRIEGFVPVIPVMPNYAIIESVVDMNTVIKGSPITITGLVSGSAVIHSDFFENRLVNVTRGALLLPSADPGDGSDYFTKVLASKDVILNNALNAGEYIKIETL